MLNGCTSQTLLRRTIGNDGAERDEQNLSIFNLLPVYRIIIERGDVSFAYIHADDAKPMCIFEVRNYI